MDNFQALTEMRVWGNMMVSVVFLRFCSSSPDATTSSHASEDSLSGAIFYKSILNGYSCCQTSIWMHLITKWGYFVGSHPLFPGSAFLASFPWPDASCDSTLLRIACLVLSDISGFQTFPGGSRYRPWKWPWAKMNHSWHCKANFSSSSSWSRRTLIHLAAFLLLLFINK